MTRVTNAVASRKRTKRVLKLCKGFYGDRKNHLKQSKCALMQAQKFNYIHRKDKKADFRSLWIVRIGSAAKMHGISYSKLIHGLKLAGCTMNRKMMADLALSDKPAFEVLVTTAKAALV